MSSFPGRSSSGWSMFQLSGLIASLSRRPTLRNRRRYNFSFDHGQKEILAQGQISEYRNQHTLHGKRSGKIQTGLHSLISACAADCVTESHRSGMLVRKNPMQ